MTTTAEKIPRVPDTAWLEERFGTGSLWRPAEDELPAELTHQRSREFLTTVGFPAVRIAAIGFDATHLRTDDGDALHAFDADELYGERYPDDDSPPVNFCFSVGSCGEQLLMLDGEYGGIDHYDPSGWDHGAGHQGAAASSLPGLAVLLGLIAERSDELTADDRATARAAVAALRELMCGHDTAVGESPFWHTAFWYRAD
ncbi:SUKH-4 family immunity protein [Streptomyces sp. NPDC127097]|uniref:SUKH-4 family immunity protein n=1 Tax=Streptomyces sp. NPDC127097 TaxID=3347136 RepID=UPI00364B07AC